MWAAQKFQPALVDTETMSCQCAGDTFGVDSSRRFCWSSHDAFLPVARLVLARRLGSDRRFADVYALVSERASCGHEATVNRSLAIAPRLNGNGPVVYQCRRLVSHLVSLVSN